MELSEILTLITIVWTLFKVLADAPKGWKNACKGWELVRAHWSSLLIKPIGIAFCNTFRLSALSSPPPVQNTTIVPLTGILRLNGSIPSTWG